MRISKKAKEETRKIILKIAQKLFTQKGFEETTTRDIASGAGIAVGTLFNYFPSKESLAMAIVSKAMEKGRKNYFSRCTGEEDLSENLFLLISSELRQLKPYRKFIGPVLERAMSLFSKASISSEGETARIEHLEIVQEIITKHGHSSVPEAISSSLYWSLYLGILAFWSNDDSRNQEETLALVDYSINLYSQTVLGKMNP